MRDDFTVHTKLQFPRLLNHKRCRASIWGPLDRRGGSFGNCIQQDILFISKILNIPTTTAQRSQTRHYSVSRHSIRYSPLGDDHENLNHFILQQEDRRHSRPERREAAVELCAEDEAVAETGGVLLPLCDTFPDIGAPILSERTGIDSGSSRATLASFLFAP